MTTVNFEIIEEVAALTFHNPPVNALNDSVKSAFHQAVLWAVSDHEVVASFTFAELDAIGQPVRNIVG